MIYLLIAAVCAAVGVAPLLIARKGKGVIGIGIAGFVVIALMGLVFTPSLGLWPLGGMFGISVLAMWFASAAFAREDRPFVLPILGVVLYLMFGLSGCDMFRATDYARLVGPIEERQWTQDVQPKDPRHMRMANTENAMYRAKNKMGSAGAAIGSQFHLEEEDMTVQMYNHEMISIVPLDFNGFWQWNNAGCAPGYIKVDAEDEKKDAEYVALPDSRKICYSPNAYWGHDLERHLRLNGYVNYGFVHHTFQLDPSGKPWWVIPTFDPKMAWWGEKVDGVLLVDPYSGDIKPESLSNLDPWINRVVPSDYVKEYLKDWGQYTNGFWNTSVGGSVNLSEPEDPTMIYGEGDEAEWVTGMVAKNSNNNRSLVYLIYTDTRTGRSRKYVTNGGSSDSAILEAVGHNNQVKYQNLHAAIPQIYNIQGTMAAVSPLLNAIHAFQGVAVVDVQNIQTVAVGNDALAAVTEYKKMIGSSGKKTAVDKNRERVPFTGVVDRFRKDGTTCYFTFRNVPRIFMVAADRSPSLSVTQPGDRVNIIYDQTDEDTVTVDQFQNLSVPLQSSPEQQEVRASGQENQEGQRSKEENRTIRDNLKQLSDQELRDLDRQLKQNRQTKKQ